MKTVLTALFMWVSFISFAQNDAKIKQIDSIVSSINSITTNITRDTLKQDNAQIGMFARTYLTSVAKDGMLVKYTNNVHTTMSVNGVSESFISNNIFYYNNSKLIKVEEDITRGERRNEMEYYFEDDKVIFVSPNMPELKTRGEELAVMGKMMMNTVKPRLKSQ